MKNFATANGILTIDLNAIADNYKYFKKIVTETCNVAGVVKANAYGTGAKEISKLLEDLGCQQFFVATLDEALELRPILPSSKIAVLGGFMHNEGEEYLKNNILPVINSPDDLERWRVFSARQNNPLPYILHFDTGMNRLGFSKDETKKLLQTDDSNIIKNAQIIMSHFACADEKDHKLTVQQAQNFAQIASRFPNTKKSLANSSGLFRDHSYHYDIVRPGYALYGGNPTPETQNPMKSVVRLHTRILQIRECKKGETVGYSATHKFSKDTKTATIATGYADGFLRSGSGKACLYYDNQPCPILGRVSMDLISIDISHIKDKSPKTGDSIEILGPNQSVDDLATSLGTIGYEVLTSLGRRYKREYI